jgi:hypothetical protein
MASTSAFCNSAKQNFLNGTNLAANVYKIALYTATAVNDKTTTAYSATNEVSGTGYTAGGQTLVGFTVSISGDTAYMDWTTDPSWTGASLTAASALIYNSSVGNQAVAVIDFGGTFTSTAGTFTVQLPAPGTTAIIRIA